MSVFSAIFEAFQKYQRLVIQPGGLGTFRVQRHKIAALKEAEGEIFHRWSIRQITIMSLNLLPQKSVQTASLNLFIFRIAACGQFRKQLFQNCIQTAIRAGDDREHLASDCIHGIVSGKDLFQSDAALLSYEESAVVDGQLAVFVTQSQFTQPKRVLVRIKHIIGQFQIQQPVFFQRRFFAGGKNQESGVRFGSKHPIEN